MRNVREALTILGLILLFVLSWAAQGGAAPITSFADPLHSRANIGTNSVGLPAGDQQWVSISTVSPTAGTTVTATQGAVTRPLAFTPSTASPTLFRSLAPFDAALTGSWSITAINGPNSAGPIFTNTIPNPQLLPLAQNLLVVGTGETPTITWALPDLTGFDVDRTSIYVHNDATNNWLDFIPLPGTPTQFTFPSGVLIPGVPYIFTVALEDSEFGAPIENSSNAFTQSPYFVPEPGTGALLGAGLAALASRWRRGGRPAVASHDHDPGGFSRS